MAKKNFWEEYKAGLIGDMGYYKRSYDRTGDIEYLDAYMDTVTKLFVRGLFSEDEAEFYRAEFNRKGAFELKSLLRRG